MRNLRVVIALFAGCLMAAGVFVACQGYQFEQVTPKAIGTIKQPTPITGVPQPAKIMLVLDKSGSMKQKADSEDWGCCESVTAGNQCNGYSASAGDCKWNILKHLLVDTGGFLDQTAGNARYGVASFANKDVSKDACNAGKVLVDIASGNNVAEVKTEIQDIVPLGGTPTAQILQDVGNDSNFITNTDSEKYTARYVILITDGMPNCNNSLDGATCWCTGGDCVTTPLNCLDDARTIDAIKTLYGKGVTTIVIGFGNVTSNPKAVEVLNAAATAGAGKPTTFASATSQTELQVVLDKIVAQLQPCVFALAQKPDKESLLEVSLSDTDPGADGAFDGKCSSVIAGDCTLVKGTDWDFTDTSLGAVSIKNTPSDKTDPKHSWCEMLQKASPNRYTLNFVSVAEMK